MLAVVARPRHRRNHSEACWLVAGYGGLAGFLALEGLLREPGSAASLKASKDDRRCLRAGCGPSARGTLDSKVPTSAGGGSGWPRDGGRWPQVILPCVACGVHRHRRSKRYRSPGGWPPVATE